jgi:hypothetical protein
VTRPPTYGELIETAGAVVAHAMDTRRDSRTAQMRGSRRLVSVAARHAAFLAESFALGQAHEAAKLFAHDLARNAIELGDEPPDRAEPWRCAADLLGVAHDLLATHLGPDCERLSPFAPAHDDQAALRYALSNVGQLVLLATGDLHRFRRSHVVTEAGAAGYRLLVRLGPTAPALTLRELQPLMLTMPDPDPDPLLSAVDAMRFLRQAVYAQVIGREQVTLGVVKDVTRIAFVSHDLLARRPGAPADPELRAAQAALGRFGARLQNRPAVTPRPAEFRDAALDTNERLLALRLTADSDADGLAQLRAAADGLAADLRHLARQCPRAERPEIHRTIGGRRRWLPEQPRLSRQARDPEVYRA